MRFELQFPMLCKLCQKVFEGNFHLSDSSRRRSRPHHKSVTNLYDATLSECPICMRILGRFVEQYWEKYYCADDTKAQDRTRMFIEDLSRGTFAEPFTSFRRHLGQDHELASSDNVVSFSALSDTSIIQYKFYSPEKSASSYSALLSKDLDINFTLQALVSEPHRTLRRPPRDLWLSTPAGKEQIHVFFRLSPIQNMTIFPEPQDLIENSNWPLHLGKRWLENCIKTHPKCHIRDVPPWLPTRLLELDAPDTGSLRLIHTKANEILLTEPYITLSHCWGNIELLKLEKVTVAQLNAGIEVSVLPQTFQDAVAVALMLGVKYLWIDFLCIFQDSNDDWSREASLMGAVYLNGFCNIAATAAKDGNSVLFCTRHTPILQDCFVNSTWEDKTNHSWRVHLEFFLRSELLDGPLLYRGWVVQERIMARRVLHFGTRQMYWECQKHDACETYRTGIPRFGPTRKQPFKSEDHDGLDIASQKSILPSNPRSKRLSFWHQILRAYSECQLTREEDKLVAISGLAKAFQTSLGGIEYLAGLWRISLIQDLCWGLDVPGKRPKQYRAPSWSWASVDGVITDFGYLGFDRNHKAFDKGVLVQIIEASIELRGSDPTGEVKGGLIRLQGYLLTINVVRPSEYSLDTSSWKITINGVSAKLTRNPVHQDANEDGYKLHCLPMQWWDHNRKTKLDCILLRPTGSRRG